MLARTSQASAQHQTIAAYDPLKPRQRSGASLSTEAIRLLSSIGPPPPLTPPRMGLLVAGLHLVCCWRYLGALVEGFDSRGLNVLYQMWATAVTAVFLGQLAKYFAPVQHSADEDLDLVVPEHTLLQHSSKLTLKEGQELGLPLGGKAAAAAAAGGVGGLYEQQQQQQEEEDEDDMAVIKRRAQEEAAAKLAKYRAEVQQLLASIRREASSTSSSGTPVDAQLLYRLADQLFASSINVSEFVELDGVPVVVEAVRANTRCLAAALPPQQRQQQQQQEIEEERQPVQDSRQAAALPSMLQASWVLLQLSQGPPACKAALQEPLCSGALLAAAQTVSALPPAAGRAPEAILRNIWWTLLTLSDKPARGLRSNSSSSQRGAAAAGATQQQPLQDTGSVFRQQLLGQFQQFGAVPMLQQLVSLRHGLSAGWVAAAHLGLLMQLGHQQQQSQQQQPAVQDAASSSSELQALAAAAAQAVLQEDSVTGLCYLMTHLRLEQPPAAQDQQQLQQAQRQHLSGRMRVLVEGMLHFLLTFHGPQLLQQLLELQLLGCFAAHSSPRLGRLLVCQLLSSKGQEVMAAVEQGYELDVALGLAQIIPLKVHVRVPAPAQQQQPAAGEIEPAGEAAAQQEQQQLHRPQPPADDLYTDILACRLLLQHQRLGELLSAFCEELQAPADPEQQARAQLSASDPVAAAADAAARECSVVAAGAALIQHLMSRDLQLQAAKHVRGDCVSDTFSGTSSSSRSLDEALAMPDHSGVYSQVMAGMVPAGRLPAAAVAASASACASTSSSSTHAPGLSLPAAAPAQQQPAAAGRAGAGAQVVFKFGEQQHAIDTATFKQLRQCSKLVSSILGRARSQQEPVTVLAIPQFTDEANCWVLQCLERWLSTAALEGFSVLQAAQLWVAADFLQVDELQVACEDLIAAGLKADPQAHMPVALELCARHQDSGGRLLRLLVQQLLRDVSSACASAGAPCALAQDGSAQLRLLRQALEKHASLLLPVMQAELRDRLVTLCMLNAGQDAEDPLDVVG